jgi:4-aminobutyrate aminotransferase
MNGAHAKLLARHRAVMPPWLTLYYDEPIGLSHGEGCRVTDLEGRDYLDFFGGILTTMVGHAVPEIVEAVRAQAGRLLHSSTLYLMEQQVALAERIAALSRIPDARVFFTTSGTEANEAALLLATSRRRSNQVLALRGSYHGRSYATMGVTGNRSWSASGFSPLNVSYVQSGYRYRSPFGHLGDAEFTDACVDDLRSVIATTTSGDIAAMIAEPIQGVGGFAVPPDGFFGAMKAVLDEMDIPFVSDEVQTGWGRTGEHFWGIEAHGFTPDMMTFAKGLGNGVAIAGVVGRAELMDHLPANSISTFGGNPIAASAALATLDYLETHDLQANARVVGARLLDGLRAAAPDHPSVGEVRGRGLMVGVELVVPGSKLASPEMAAAVLEHTRRRGLLIGKGGLGGNVLRIAPPLSLSGPEADEGLAILVESLTAAADEVFAQASEPSVLTEAGR